MRIWKIAISGVLAAILLLTAVAPAIAAPETKDKVQVQFQNKTDSSVRITLTGPATVYLTLNTGKTKTEMIPGTYKYSYYACGTTITGTFKVKAGANLSLLKCKASNGGAVNEGKVQFQNQTGSPVVITLTGPATVYLSLGTGKTIKDMIPGIYKYSYNACGTTITGTFKVKAGANLSLPKCKKGGGGSAGEKKQAITNNTGGTLTMILSGPQNYTFYVATGRSQISLVKGTYNYTIYGCGSVLTGSRKLPGGGNWIFWCY